MKYLENEDRARQVVRFDGLEFERVGPDGEVSSPISPTDIDALLNVGGGRLEPTEPGGRYRYVAPLLVYLELKLRGWSRDERSETGIPWGQEIAIVTAADRAQRGGANALVLVAEHDIEDPNEPVVAAEAVVVAHYRRRRWSTDHAGRTVRDVLLQAVETFSAAAGWRPVDDESRPEVPF